MSLLDPILVGSLRKVDVVLLCCGLVLAFKLLPSCWKWVTHFIHRRRWWRGFYEIDRSPTKCPPNALSVQREVDASIVTSPPDVEYGLQTLHCPPMATIDIVAVHSLGANPKYAWVWNPKNNPSDSNAHPDKAVNWLVDFLPEKIPFPCQIMTFNYNSTWIFDAPQQRLSTISNELLICLRNKREKTTGRPLIFIGHGFGGNVIEQAIVSASRHGSEYWDVAGSTVGAIFLGTPHRGSPAAKWGALIASNAWKLKVVTENRILKDLEEQSGTLADRLDDFSSWLFSYSVRVMCCFEKNVTDYSSRIGPLGNASPSEWTKQLVVPKSNACIDGHVKLGLATDHFKINKFYGLRDPSFECVSSEIVRMAEGAEETLRRRRNPPRSPTDDEATSPELQECLREMFLTDSKIDLRRLERLKGKRVGHTCEWLLKREELSAWGAKSNPQLLRLVGSPGIGKTMMSIFLVNELREKAQRSPNTTFAYFFCDNKDKFRNTPTAILRSVIRQLLLQRHALFKHIRSEFNVQKSRLFENFDSLWQVLESMLRDDHAGEVLVLVDALDECEPSLRKDLLHSIKELFYSPQTGSIGRFKFLITYRPDEDIEDILRPVGASLRVDSGDINLDLSEYIDSKVEDLANQKKYAADLKNKVRDALKRKAEGTFLWVSLMIADLKEISNYDVDVVEQKLETLPDGLNGTYARILGQIPEEEKKQAQFLLRLVVVARRPLTKYEIATAFCIWKTDSIPLYQALDAFSDICSTCKSIIHVDTKGNDDSSGGGVTVNFLHQSVRDFLLPDRSGVDVQWYHTSVDSANLHMLQVCWKYLSMKVFPGHLIIRRETHYGGLPIFSDLRPYFQEHFFLEYAFQEWQEHAAASYPALLDRFEVNFENSLKKAPTLRDAWLVRAAQEGQEAVVKLLLDTGKADVNSRDVCGRTPLSGAATRGHEAVVKLLLDTGKANVNLAAGGYGQTPLLGAAVRGHEAVIKLLLDTGKADIDSKDGYGQTPLSGAAMEGHEAVVKLLLDTGKTDVDSKNTYGKTPLSRAAAGGNEAVIKLLLDTGKADVNSKDSFRRTPLSWAAKRGHEAVIKLLLDTGKADVDSKNRNDQTPLSLAVKEGHKAVVKLLLDTGKADVNLKYDDGKTLLSLAAERGHEAVVKLLLDTGKADVDSKDNCGQTPLLWAATEGHETVVKLLLDTGKADVKSKDGKYGQTPLSLAAERGHEAVVKLLQSPIPIL